MADDELHELVQHAAELSKSGLPLPAGLRAAAAECHSGRLAAALRRLADRVEAGQPLDKALAEPRQRWPEQFAALVRGAVRTGDPGAVLAQVLEHHRAVREVQRSIRSALAYPALVLLLLALLLTFFSLVVVGRFAEMYRQFEFDLPESTNAALAMGEFGAWVFLASVAAALLLPPVLRRVLGSPRWNYVVAAVPLVGPAWRWANVAEMARLLGTYLQHDIPLPEALRLTGEASGDVQLADACADLAGEVETGRSLSDAVAEDGRLPQSIVPLLRWGEQTRSLAEACDVARESFERRALLRSAWIRAVLPPAVFVIVGVIVLGVVWGLMMPLMQSIDKLS
jgi:type II secretory pathway component PulF